MSELVKAQLIALDASNHETSYKVEVQFNPETLKVSFANQVQAPPGQAAHQGNASALQFVGRGSTKLAVQLWFDVTGLPSEAEREALQGDVRKLTEKVVYFITPIPQDGQETSYLPPKLRFLWGSFQFDGIVESMEESLEFFSPEGRPLRASISLNVVQQEIQFSFGNAAKAPPGTKGGTPGTQALTAATANSDLPSLADRQGKGDRWQSIAAANGIENPRRLQPGQLINMNAVAAVQVSTKLETSPGAALGSSLRSERR